MKPGDSPYQIQVRAWRDEQPGDDPVLHLSVRLDPRANADPWPGLRLAGLRLATGASEWTPTRQSMESAGVGAFEVRANGEPTLEAGVEAVLSLALDTARGRKKIEISGIEVELVQ